MCFVKRESLADHLEAWRLFQGQDLTETSRRRGLLQMTLPTTPRQFQTRVHDSGKCFFPNLDNIQDILDEVEGPSYKRSSWT